MPFIVEVELDLKSPRTEQQAAEEAWAILGQLKKEGKIGPNSTVRKVG